MNHNFVIGLIWHGFDQRCSENKVYAVKITVIIVIITLVIKKVCQFNYYFLWYIEPWAGRV